MKFSLFFMMFFVSLSACERQTSRIWSIKKDCRHLAQLMKADSIEMYDNDYGDPVCSLSKDKSYMYNFRGSEARGAVRGMAFLLNESKQEPLRKCVKRDKCRTLKFPLDSDCYFKCQDKVGIIKD